MHTLAHRIHHLGRDTEQQGCRAELGHNGRLPAGEKGGGRERLKQNSFTDELTFMELPSVSRSRLVQRRSRGYIMDISSCDIRAEVRDHLSPSEKLKLQRAGEEVCPWSFSQ